MKFSPKPIVSLAIGLILGAGCGLGFFWHEARILVNAARAARLSAEAEKRPDKPWDFWTLEIDSLASELKEQKAVLAAREQALVVREERLATDQRELAKTRQQIESLRAEIAGKMIELDGIESKNLKTLAKTYSEITPKAAVSILHEMDETTVVKILSQMKSDVVSPLLQEMGGSSDPAFVKQAARLSDRLRLVKQTTAP